MERLYNWGLKCYGPTQFNLIWVINYWVQLLAINALAPPSPFFLSNQVHIYIYIMYIQSVILACLTTYYQSHLCGLFLQKAPKFKYLFLGSFLRLFLPIALTWVFYWYLFIIIIIIIVLYIGTIFINQISQFSLINAQ